MKTKRLEFLIEYHTQPDDYGRRRFTLLWSDPDGCFRPEPDNFIAGPVGFRRGQVFFADPAEHVARLESNGHFVREAATGE